MKRLRAAHWALLCATGALLVGLGAGHIAWRGARQEEAGPLGSYVIRADDMRPDAVKTLLGAAIFAALEKQSALPAGYPAWGARERIGSDESPDVWEERCAPRTGGGSIECLMLDDEGSFIQLSTEDFATARFHPFTVYVLPRGLWHRVDFYTTIRVQIDVSATSASTAEVTFGAVADALRVLGARPSRP